MIPIAVCDDERVHGLRTREVILSYGGVQDSKIQLFETPDALLDAIRLRGYSPGWLCWTSGWRVRTGSSWQNRSTTCCLSVPLFS